MLSDDDTSFVLAYLLFIVVLIGGLIFGSRMIRHHYSVQQCAAYQVATHRDTRFVDYTFWEWDCITPTDGGHWISTDQLRDVL